MIEIMNGGMLSSIQDSGRFGVMRNGFTQGGAMDSYSMKLANKLCSNDVNAPVIEMTMLGITAKFIDEHIFALSGGHFNAKLNNKPILTNKAYKADKGDILSIGCAVSGMRCYLAIGGGFKVDKVMGSASTNIKLGIGGFEGRKLRCGDILRTYEFKNSLSSIESHQLPENEYGSDINIRVVLGPQDNMFTETDLAFFTEQQYTVTPNLDRMGIRLNGIALHGKNGMDIISDAITFGSVQIARSGMPIILMADHQTTGGYAKIATVISVDLPKLAQVKPYDKIHFSTVSVKEAERLAKKQKRFFEKLKFD
ncbi:MAG: biotin-dependent carboxyltransferase family protein [Eubacterium sp.]